MNSDDELQTLTLAFGNHDQAALDRMAPQLGLAFDAGALHRLIQKAYSPMTSPLELAKLALSTFDTEHGIAIWRFRRRSISRPSTAS